VTNATPGNSPTVSFSLFDKSGNPLDITKLTSISLVLGGGNVDYGYGTTGIRVSEKPAATATGKNGLYSYTMTNKIPVGATGSYTVSIEAYNTVTLMPGTTVSTTATDAAAPVEYYFSVDKSAVAARRVVVDQNKCQSCHLTMGFVHGGSRAATQECVICHNPTLQDGTSGDSVNFAWEIHSIHSGSNLTNPYTLGTTNFQSVLFPGDTRDCLACHMTGTYLPENVGAKAPVASKGGFTPTTMPISAACQGCHDDIGTASHALSNTSSLGEACVACHKAGEAYSVDRVHQRIF
jgi:OmcA/MtrC family decaheme c-type cytochrome